MFPHLQHLRKLDRLQRVPRRIVVDRMNPFQAMEGNEFIFRFRQNKEAIHQLIQTIQNDLSLTLNNRGKSINNLMVKCFCYYHQINLTCSRQQI